MLFTCTYYSLDDTPHCGQQISVVNNFSVSWIKLFAVLVALHTGNAHVRVGRTFIHSLINLKTKP